MSAKWAAVSIGLAAVVLLLFTSVAGGTTRSGIVTGRDIKDHTISSVDLIDHTIQAHDLSVRLVNSLKGQTGQRGPVGATGAQGPKGDTGATGAQGPKGDTGATGANGATGATGPKGDPGAGLHVAGVVATLNALDGVTGMVTGDAYLVTASEHLFVWNGSAWVDAGPMAGIQGPAGPPGAAGPAGVSGYQIVTGAAVSVAPSDWVVNLSVSCPTGKVAIAGGVQVADPQNSTVNVASSYPTLAGTTGGWRIVMQNWDDYSASVTPYAVCATVGTGS